MSEEGSFTFTANSVDDLVTLASMMEPDQSVVLTSEEIKEIVPELLKLRNDIEESHEILNKMEIPNLGEGTEGILKRLQYLYSKGSK